MAKYNAVSISEKVGIRFHVEHWKDENIYGKKGNKPYNETQAAMVIINPLRMATQDFKQHKGRSNNKENYYV